MLKNEHVAWQLFETLSENSLHHMSATQRDPSSAPKWGGIYEVGHAIDIYSKVDELSQKLDQLLQGGTASSPAQQNFDVCSICSSPNHMITDCPSAHQFLEFVQEQVHQAQTRMAPRTEPWDNWTRKDKSWERESTHWSNTDTKSPIP